MSYRDRFCEARRARDCNSPTCQVHNSSDEIDRYYREIDQKRKARERQERKRKLERYAESLEKDFKLSEVSTFAEYRDDSTCLVVSDIEPAECEAIIKLLRGLRTVVTVYQVNCADIELKGLDLDVLFKELHSKLSRRLSDSSMEDFSRYEPIQVKEGSSRYEWATNTVPVEKHWLPHVTVKTSSGPYAEKLKMFPELFT